MSRFKHGLLYSLVIVLFGCGSTDTSLGRLQEEKDDRAPSVDPPGGLDASKVPQFVTIAWNNNYNLEGVMWSLDLFRQRQNPRGEGRLGTYDGTPITATYFNTSVDVEARGMPWKEALEAGHEMGNHTAGSTDLTLSDGKGSDNYELWLSQMQACQKAFADKAGIPAALVTGFRAPGLTTSEATFQAVGAMGFVYDASLEEGFQFDQDGSNFLWPYTLDHGSPGNESRVRTDDNKLIKSHPGLWEMPAYAVLVPPDTVAEDYGVSPDLRDRLAQSQPKFAVDQGKITGFDYNLWTNFALSNEEVLAILKYTLDQRLSGNRAPMLFGAHTDLYVGAEAPERRAVIGAFIVYALSKPDVRIVGISRALEWIRRPIPLR